VTCGYRVHMVVAATMDTRHCGSWWRSSERWAARSGNTLNPDGERADLLINPGSAARRPTARRPAARRPPRHG
jgi:hypothetical protein